MNYHILNFGRLFKNLLLLYNFYWSTILKMFLPQLLNARLANTMIKRLFSQSQPLRQGVNNHSPNNMEKRFLVWSGKYKSIEEVPNFVSPDVMERCRNKVRIRLANIMMLLTVIGCGVMVYSGKEAAKRGETVTKQNLDWHKKYNEQTQKQDP
uniref:Uncharacterized protein n=1 Tax=Glossina austeni TaxID=7395 RepID=A0A1A9UQI2_GLOAU